MNRQRSTQRFARAWIARGLALACAVASGCGGTKGTLTVSFVVPVGPDPFARASSVHIAVGTPAFAETTLPVTAGHFSGSVNFKPASSTVAMEGAVIVEALAADGSVVARGQSPALGILPQDSAVSVLVSTPGTMATLAAALATPRLSMAVAEVPRLGVVFEGGTIDGKAQTTNEVFQLYSVAMLTGSDLPSARPSSVALGLDRSTASTGVAMLTADSSSPSLLEFDPVASTAGTWTSVASDPSLVRERPSLTAFSDGNVLLAGGTQNGAPLTTATLITIGSTFGVAPVATMMAAARSGHTATNAHLAQGDGVVFFGGNSAGPTVEAWIEATRGYAAIPVDVDTRTAHAAVQRTNGNVLIIGGQDRSATALDSGYEIDPGKLTGTLLPRLLSIPRAGHTASRVGDVILVCGGRDASGKSIASCDVIDEKTLTLRKTIATTIARSGHYAVILETGPVLIAGGAGDDGKAIATLEIYTP